MMTLTGLGRLLCGIAVMCALTTAPAQAATMTQEVLVIDGTRRLYTLYTPAGFDRSKRYPIVLGLHGGLGNGKIFARQSGLPDKVDRYRFIGVFPDSAGQQWNDGRGTTRTNTDDVAFLTRLIGTIATDKGGDPQRVFVTGISNGGMMAQRLACDAAGTVTAVAAVAANMPADLDCKPARAVPIVLFNGTADPLMPWAGGEIRKGRFIGAGGIALSAPQTFAFWARANGCRTEQSDPLPGSGDATHVIRHGFGTCAGAPTLLYEIQGGGHTWPGGNETAFGLLRPILGPASKAIDATQVMLDFFGRYGLTRH